MTRIQARVVQVLRVYNKYLEFDMITDNVDQAAGAWKCTHALDFIACFLICAAVVASV